jgi:hypothetical protein
MASIFYLFKRVDGLAGWWMSWFSVSFFALTLSLHFSFFSLLGFLLTHYTSEGCLYATVFLIPTLAMMKQRHKTSNIQYLE